jgi:hypothetical protein
VRNDVEVRPELLDDRRALLGEQVDQPLAAL